MRNGPVSENTPAEAKPSNKGITTFDSVGAKKNDDRAVSGKGTS